MSSKWEVESASDFLENVFSDLKVPSQKNFEFITTSMEKNLAWA